MFAKNMQTRLLSSFCRHYGALACVWKSERDVNEGEDVRGAEIPKRLHASRTSQCLCSIYFFFEVLGGFLFGWFGFVCLLGFG